MDSKRLATMHEAKKIFQIKLSQKNDSNDEAQIQLHLQLAMCTQYANTTIVIQNNIKQKKHTLRAQRTTCTKPRVNKASYA